MNYPNNFTRGDIDDETFQKAFELAFKKKSKISIQQLLKHSGVSKERAEEYGDMFIAEAKKARSRANRPHIVIGWLAIVVGIGSTITLFQSGWVFFATIILTLWGVYWVVTHRD